MQVIVFIIGLVVACAFCLWVMSPTSTAEDLPQVLAGGFLSGVGLVVAVPLLIVCAVLLASLVKALFGED